MIVLGFPSTTGGSGGGGGGGGGLTADCVPATRNKFGFTSSLTTTSVVASGSGGTAPYTYSWATVGMTANSPTSGTTTFTKSGLFVGQVYNETAVCTVTDAVGATATAQCDVTFERSGA